jgi:large subunit ribosomal protein L18
MLNKKEQRLRRARQTRVRIALQRVARLTVFRSKVVASVSTAEKALRAQLGNGGNTAAASAVGRLIAEKARAAGIERVAFDRAGFAYHGRVKALAEAAREAGLQF